jgi:hypothetical protein
MVIVLLTVLLTYLVWFPLLTSETKPWEAGDLIPGEPPSEDCRVGNEAGSSVVSQPNWTIRNGAKLIHLTPRQVVAGRSRAGMVVSVVDETPSKLGELERAEFLGRPAHLKVGRRPSTFDDPPLTTWTYSFRRGGRWYEVSYFVAEAHVVLPENARRYLEIVRTSAEE